MQWHAVHLQNGALSALRAEYPAMALPAVPACIVPACCLCSGGVFVAQEITTTTPIPQGDFFTIDVLRERPKAQVMLFMC